MVRSLAAALLLLTACSADRIELFEGTLSEVQFNALTLTGDDGRSVHFGIEEAEMSHAGELVSGSFVKVYYRGRIKDGSAAAVRVEVDPTVSRLLGRWIETGEGSDEYGMGFELASGGVAYSIGMQTLVFTAWEPTRSGGLKLSGNSIGNGNTISFSEEWEILDLGPSRLTIGQDDLTLHFRRETAEDVQAREERNAALLETLQKPAGKRR